MVLELLEAIKRSCRTARSAARTVAFLAPYLVSLVGVASIARAANTNPAYLNINVQFNGITNVNNLTATSGSSAGTINLTWTEPLHAAGTPPFVYDVRVSSVAQIPNQVAFSTNSALSAVSPSLPPTPGAGGGSVGFTVTGLTPGVVYYFAIVEHDSGALSDQWVWSIPLGRNPNNSAAAAFGSSASVIPMEPLGVVVAPSANSVSLSWSTTTRFSNGTSFAAGPVTPVELQGYEIDRSLQLCSGFVKIATMTASFTSLTDVTGGANYYYRIFSFNTNGYSAGVVTVSTLGERWYFVDDCASSLAVDNPTAEGAGGLNAATNGLGGDIRIVRTRLPQDAGGGTYQSVQWNAYLNGVTLLPNYALPQPGHYALHVTTQPSGVPIPDNQAIGPFSVANQPFTVTPQTPSAGTATPGVGVADLGAYWNNNQSFVKMYGRVDTVADTVNLDSPNLGYYQVRAQSRSTGVVFDASSLSSRIFTPNGDGLNDVMIFTYDPGPNNVQAVGRVYNLHGEHIADLVPGAVPNTLIWDGKMNGHVVSSGVYVYRISGGGKTFSGTVVVAR